MIGPAGFMAGPKEHVHKHVWVRALGKLKMHLILCPANPDLAWRQTACGQTVFIRTDGSTAPRCMACERTNLGRAEKSTSE